jgi:TDG/mug DNA glycosylase family protein
MIEYKVSSNANILFVGINPHPGSFRRGVPFSNNKMFWYLLQRAGLLRESLEELKSDAVLRRMYETRFCPEYRLNFVNIIDRPTVQVSQLQRGEEGPGVRRLQEIIITKGPKIVCFVGKITLQKFRGCANCEYGWQPDLFASRLFLMHSPIRGFASIRVAELEEVKRAAFQAAI